MRAHTKRAIAAVAVAAFSALVAWASGYNFDERSFGVGVYTFWTVLFAVFAATYPYNDW